MALDKNFYNEIFEQEQEWIEFIEKNLLNSIYCNLTLKPFYEKRIKKLKEEYDSTPNEIINQIILKLSDLVNEISYLNYQYLNNQTPNTQALLPFFLTNQMNNVMQKDNIDIQNKKRTIDQVEIENQNLQEYNRSFREVEDYVYEDFPEEVIKAK